MGPAALASGMEQAANHFAFGEAIIKFGGCLSFLDVHPNALVLE